MRDAADDSAPPSPESPRAPIRGALVAGALAFLIYTLTSPAGISWEHSGEDGPEFAAVAKVFGIAHPTGYPLFTLLTRVASIGAAENAWRVQLFVNLCAAIAVAMSFLFFWRVAGSRVGAAIGAALLAISPIWWAQATIIEVYPLHLAFMAGLFYLALSPGGWPRRLLLLAWVGGLALVHHRMAAIAAPSLAVLAGAALWRHRPIRWGYVAMAVPLVLLPLSLYLVLLIRSQFDPALDWGNPETWGQLGWVARGEQYRFRMFHEPLSAFAERARVAAFEVMPAQFGVSALGLSLIGLVAFRRRGGAAAWWSLVVYLLLSLVAYAGYDIPDPDAYTLPMTFVLAAFAALGAAWLLERRWFGGRWAGALVAVALLAFPASRLPALWRTTTLHDDRGAEEYAREALALLPEKAVVLSDGDGRSFSLWYRQAVNGDWDKAIVYRLLLVWPWYHENLRGHHPDLALPPVTRSVLENGRQFVTMNLAAGHAVYTTTVDEWLADGWSAAPEGRLFRVLAPRRSWTPPGTEPRWHALDLSAIANCDYRLDPFTAGSFDSTGLIFGIGGGRQHWGRLPLVVPRPRASTGQWSVFTTGGVPAITARLPLEGAPTSMVVLAVDAWSGPASLRLGEVRVEYETGPADTVVVQSYANVWDFHAESQEVRLPNDLVVWFSTLDQSLTALPIPVDPGRRAVALVLTGEGPKTSDGRIAGYTVFAATQVLAGP
jgi:hypothetical protein